MIYVTERTDDGDYEVWIHLEKDAPQAALTSFIVGIGRTREAALQHALGDLTQARARVETLLAGLAPQPTEPTC